MEVGAGSVNLPTGAGCCASDKRSKNNVGCGDSQVRNHSECTIRGTAVREREPALAVRQHTDIGNGRNLTW
jgi:hypothetical protein